MSGFLARGPRLELVRHGNVQRVFELKSADLHIGRVEGVDVLFDDNKVSRHHARIERRHDGGFDIIDLESQNHTFVEGKKLNPFERVSLADGNRIKIVEYELIFRQPSLMVRESDQGGSTVLGTLEDLSSESLASRSKEAVESFEAVLKVIRSLAGSTDLNELLEHALEGLMEVFPRAERGFILTAEPDGKLPLRAVFDRAKTDDPPTLSRTILEEVLKKGKAIRISDTAVDPVFKDRESVALTIRSALCVPLLDHDRQPLGMVQLESRARRAKFKQEHLDLLAALAVPIGVAVENDRLLKKQASWAAAREIQFALLPRRRPEIPGYSFWEFYRPALEVGGDLYDYIPVESEGRGPRLSIVVGDVTGKGMPAALIMAGICPEIRHLIRGGASPHEVLARVNRHIHDDGVEGRFVTMVIVEIDPASHVLKLAEAGHTEVLIRRAGGEIKALTWEGEGPMLGAFRDARFQPAALSIEPGDVVVLYSDGVTDAIDRNGRAFGLDRLKQVLSSASPAADAAGEAILAAVCNHSAGRSQFDDITLVVFSRDAPED